jgi:predicted membrane-bound mannosyltransferase
MFGVFWVLWPTFSIIPPMKMVCGIGLAVLVLTGKSAEDSS